MELIKVNVDTQTVSARELHERLKLHSRIGFQECVSMDLRRERTFAQK